MNLLMLIVIKKRDNSSSKTPMKNFIELISFKMKKKQKKSEA